MDINGEKSFFKSNVMYHTGTSGNVINYYVYHIAPSNVISFLTLYARYLIKIY